MTMSEASVAMVGGFCDARDMQTGGHWFRIGCSAQDADNQQRMNVSTDMKKGQALGLRLTPIQYRQNPTHLLSTLSGMMCSRTSSLTPSPASMPLHLSAEKGCGLSPPIWGCLWPEMRRASVRINPSVNFSTPRLELGAELRKRPGTKKSRSLGMRGSRFVARRGFEPCYQDENLAS